MKCSKTTALGIVLVSLMMITGLTSCVKDNFSVPSPGANIDPPGWQPTMTIAQFKQRYYVPVLGKTLPTLITDSVVISGIINADDKSGNFYKEVSLQDSTGGIALKIDGTNLYYQYPIGRRIFISVKNMYIFDYGGTCELGGFIDLSGTYPSVGGILTANFPNSIAAGQWGLTVPVRKTTISQLTFGNYIDLQSMLYELDSVEFSASDTSSTYAVELTKASLNAPLEDCSGGSMIVRSSGYANFANNKVAKGNGTLLGIFTYYSYASTGNYQLTIRDTTDIRFNGPRCH